MLSETLQVRVDRIRKCAADIACFDLVDPAKGDLPEFAPGSHINVYLGPDLVRQYSLYNGPADRDCYRIAVKREPNSRGGSATMHEQLQEGDLLTISAPRNNFPLDAGASHSLLVAGGIGITPILSMGLHLRAVGASFQLLHFARSLQHTAFDEILTTLGLRDNVRLFYGLSPHDTETNLRRFLLERPSDAQLYLCGPKPFMDAVQRLATPAWPQEAIHIEYFSGNSGTSSNSGEEFEVTLARSGKTYTVPEGKSIVQALANMGVDVEVGCEEGVCGTCITEVLEGVPDHRDLFLSDQEKTLCNRMAVCVSRSKSKRLVLDI